MTDLRDLVIQHSRWPLGNASIQAIIIRDETDWAKKLHNSQWKAVPFKESPLKTATFTNCTERHATYILTSVSVTATGWKAITGSSQRKGKNYTRWCCNYWISPCSFSPIYSVEQCFNEGVSGGGGQVLFHNFTTTFTYISWTVLLLACSSNLEKIQKHASQTKNEPIL